MNSTKSSLITLGLGTLILTSDASAQILTGAQSVELEDVYACTIIESPQERLKCYDTATGRLEEAQKAGEIIVVSKSQVEDVKKDAFGFNIPSLPKLGGFFGRKSNTSGSSDVVTLEDGTKATLKTDHPIMESMEEIELSIERTKTFGYEKTRFYFTNGQVWEQTDSYKVRVRTPKDGTLNTAVIEKAALGSFLLRINGKGRAIRVKRVR